MDMKFVIQGIELECKQKIDGRWALLLGGSACDARNGVLPRHVGHVVRHADPRRTALPHRSVAEMTV